MSRIELHNIDCLPYMKQCSDKQFDLAIVDPPYGIEEMTGRETNHRRGKLRNRAFNVGEEKFGNWDFAPSKEYFKELFRISQNQIIWGGNYFELPPTRCIIAWDKCQPWENFSQIELAWTSFDYPAKLLKLDNRTSGKIHPTQKPVELYQYCLTKFAKPGDKIIDTHLGSGSIALACEEYGYDLTACEIDKEYYDGAVKRLNDYRVQFKLF
jgi:site-specific DNA-methyltransferase (adenine-specific)